MLNQIGATVISTLCVQVFILSAVIASRKHEQHANLLLSMLLSFFGLSVLNVALSVWLVYADRADIVPYLQTELLFGLGPALYLYTRCKTDPAHRLQPRAYWHFAPALLELIYYRTPFFRAGFAPFSQDYQGIAHLVFMCMQWGGFLFSSVYIGMAIRQLFLYHRWVQEHYSNLAHRNLRWLTVPVVAFASFWIVWFSFSLVDTVFFENEYRYLYFFPLLVGLMIISLWIGLQGYIHQRVSTEGFLKDTPTQTKNTNPDVLEKLMDRIDQAMQEHQYYLDADLTLHGLSTQLGVPARQISNAINNVVQVNFHSYVNKFRVDHFVKRISSPGHEQYNLLGHALESGFASKSTFNPIFKKFTGLTPSQYYRKIAK